ncbi:MAG: hypothetical protein ETSY1_21500 [Candidatus Entotheonella factor]|uniref:DUF948 domain-containing protein n=1 Tax=Entotheonella factor TaxID=1429438 RepID=W4LHZ8_ENTF1|nr:MAG: hypothetical protein ETSY1_21500 [Candidatus Entotheonella factor]
MLSTAFLGPATIVIAIAIVLVLVYYLVRTIIALRRAGGHLANVVAALQTTADSSANLEADLTTINGALSTLGDGLGAIDEDLVGVAQVFRLV